MNRGPATARDSIGRAVRVSAVLAKRQGDNLVLLGGASMRAGEGRGLAAPERVVVNAVEPPSALQLLCVATACGKGELADPAGMQEDRGWLVLVVAVGGGLSEPTHTSFRNSWVVRERRERTGPQCAITGAFSRGGV